MNTTFKSYSGLLLGAAVMLAGVFMAVPAHAELRSNGPVLNGPVFQGPVIQGPVIQGPILQGPVLQGPVLQGPIIQGISLQGVTLQGISMQGISLNGRSATHAKVGRFVAVTLASGETISLR